MREERGSKSVLVPQSEALGSIAVIRSLGRAGYRVVATSPVDDALGFRSNFTAAAEASPPYSDPRYIEWLEECLERHDIGLIVPSEGFLVALRPALNRFQHLLPVPHDDTTLYRVFSKVGVAEALLGRGAEPAWRHHVPPSLIVKHGQTLPSAEEVTRLGAPFYVKSDIILNRREDTALLKRCLSAEAVLEVLRTHIETFDAILVQGFVPGVKAAAAFCLDTEGQVVTRSSVLGLRTTPHHGGMMSLRESWIHSEMEEIGLAWLRHLDWRGVAMVECKWDPASDRFWLIEINARYWGYLHLDLFAGVDIPRIQADRFFGLPVEEQPFRRIGVRCRHAFPGDAGWLISRLKDPALTTGAKLGSGLRFIADFADPRVHADLYFPGDTRLYWIEAARYLRGLLRAARRRLGAADES